MALAVLVQWRWFPGLRPSALETPLVVLVDHTRAWLRPGFKAYSGGLKHQNLAASQKGTPPTHTLGGAPARPVGVCTTTGAACWGRPLFFQRTFGMYVDPQQPKESSGAFFAERH